MITMVLGFLSTDAHFNTILGRRRDDMTTTVSSTFTQEDRGIF
jgi:hypothetical protein